LSSLLIPPGCPRQRILCQRSPFVVMTRCRRGKKQDVLSASRKRGMPSLQRLWPVFCLGLVLFGSLMICAARVSPAQEDWGRAGLDGPENLKCPREMLVRCWCPFRGPDLIPEMVWSSPRDPSQRGSIRYFPFGYRFHKDYT
jgi:hypothetical protein